MWPKGIIIVFVAFAVFMTGLVIICLKQDITLESKDYYKEELKYQEKINAIENTKSNKPTIHLSNKQLMKVSFPIPTNIKGKMQGYKPDKSKEDFVYEFDRSFELDLSQKAKGLWKIKLSWIQNNVDYYYEEPIFIN